MKHTRIEKKNYTYHIIDTDRFKTSSLSIIFTREKTLEDNKAYEHLLSRNLVYSSKKYNTRNKISSKAGDLYGSRITVSPDESGKLISLVFDIDYLNPKYIEDPSYLDECIDYLKEVMFNPNVEKNHFNEKIFKQIKKDYITGINMIKENPSKQAYASFNKYINEGTVNEKIYPTIEEIESITSESLYTYYKNLFNGDYKIDVLTYGIYNSKIEEKIDKLLKNVKQTSIKLTLPAKRKTRKQEREIIETIKFNQSNLLIGYDLVNLTNHEKNHVLKLYNAILGSMSESLLFKHVREDHSLCYSINSSFNRSKNTLIIKAGINEANYEETKKQIFECLKMMNNKEIITKKINDAKKALDTSLNSYYDDASGQIYRFFINEFEHMESIESLRNNFQKVTIEEILNLNKKLSLNLIYLLKGEGF